VAKKYSGSFEAVAFQRYNGSDIAANSIMQLKSKEINISINGNAMFKIDYNDEILLDDNYTYQFNKDCIFALQDV